MHNVHAAGDGFFICPYFDFRGLGEYFLADGAGRPGNGQILRYKGILANRDRITRSMADNDRLSGPLGLEGRW